MAPARALANAEAILSSAAAWRRTLMVSPLPIADPEVDARTAVLSADLAALRARLGVPFLEVFGLAAASGTRAREIAAGDGAHPNGGGYALVAEAFAAWAPWRGWIGGCA